jgi:hypothetical protein
MRYETAGDPMTGLKWTRKTTEKLANELRRLGIEVSPNTVGRLLKKMRFCLRVNHKKIESGNKNPPSARERNQQFEYIKKLRKSAERDNKPIISVDTKKKEQIGKFKNLGQSWQRSALPVKDHDFPSDALGVTSQFVTKNYETGERVSDCQMKGISLLRAKTFPDWNYKIVPSQIVK